MPALTKRLTVHPETVVFATDFSPASYNAGLYASAISLHFHTNLVVAHAFVLTQPALEVEAEKPLGSQQRINLKHDLTLVAEVLKSGKGETEIALLELADSPGDPPQWMARSLRSGMLGRRELPQCRPQPPFQAARPEPRLAPSIGLPH